MAVRNFLLDRRRREVRFHALGKVGKGIKCSVSGCGNEAVRSVSAEDANRAGLKVTTTGRSYLCKDHYKEMKKRTRKDRQVERWRMKP